MWIAIALCLAWCVAAYNCQPKIFFIIAPQRETALNAEAVMEGWETNPTIDQSNEPRLQPSSNQVSVNASQNIGVINGQLGLPLGTTTSARLRICQCRDAENVEVNANQNIGVVNGEVNAGNATNVPSTTTTSTTTSAFPVGRMLDCHRVQRPVLLGPRLRLCQCRDAENGNDQNPVQTGNTTSAPSTSTTTILPTAPGRSKRSNQVEVNANQNIAVVNGEVNTGNATGNASSTTSTPTTTSAFPVGRRKRSHGRHSTPCDSSDDNEADSNEVY
ncbi:hypothetical protein DdX_18825 [Ditylenchus destructor]|uniref:Uncharacterized protein n=1 Tax=Ditylenchus destructor TaxID=166010 RepID=A0AAD4QXS9_9BILA|nr:hypothetical protein DdX_18825 [Ditylenchus destructor]